MLCCKSGLAIVRTGCTAAIVPGYRYRKTRTVRQRRHRSCTACMRLSIIEQTQADPCPHPAVARALAQPALHPLRVLQHTVARVQPRSAQPCVPRCRLRVCNTRPVCLADWQRPLLELLAVHARLCFRVRPHRGAFLHLGAGRAGGGRRGAASGAAFSSLALRLLTLHIGCTARNASSHQHCLAVACAVLLQFWMSGAHACEMAPV